ncbi:hypothetical protein, partial [Salmonella sp. LSP 148/00]|uniref:hypothetical protein n=1 Tax=Salmonella sp. LSP 148/00 TaxID=2854133 RepID=UPI003F5CABBB
FFRFSLGKTSLFAVSASESRSVRFSGARNVYYVKSTRTFKRHVKAAGFVYVKKLLAHKFDPFPAVTLREFC